MSDRVKRKLAAIVAADVVGYSRMMAADEARTIEAVRRLQHEFIEPLLPPFGGRIVKTMGDGFLMEFASVVAGVEAAIKLQEGLEQTSKEEAEGNRVLLRIGVHVGDIVVEDLDIFGDGVNVAARIEPLAAPGGIGISDEAYRQVRDRLDVDWADGGSQTVKNMARPIRVWHWQNAPASPHQMPEHELNLPDKPSIAVLPFDNMSGDPEQGFFADGMTEDLITDLSKISGLFVVARNSTFAFKEHAADISTIGRRLGVGNIVEGSVRKMGDRVRINVQLIDAATGGHIWADRYDGSLASVFELQDDVCRKVVSALSVQLTQSEALRLNEVHTTNLDAFELYVQAKSTPYPPIPERILAARELFERVVESAPDFAGGYAGLSWMISFGALWGHEDPANLGSRAEALAYKAISVDKSFGWSYTVLGFALLAQRKFDEAVAAAKQGLDLLPNDADAHVFAAVVNSMRGNSDEAIKLADQALRLSPNFINGPYLNVKSHASFMAGHYEEALASHEKNVARGGPVGPPAYCWAAGSYHATGKLESAKQTVAELNARFPNFGLKGWNLLALIESDSERERIEHIFRASGIGD